MTTKISFFPRQWEYSLQPASPWPSVLWGQGNSPAPFLGLLSGQICDREVFAFCSNESQDYQLDQEHFFQLACLLLLSPLITAKVQVCRRLMSPIFLK